MPANVGDFSRRVTRQLFHGTPIPLLGIVLYYLYKTQSVVGY